MKITFLKGHTLYSYFAGDTADVPADEAKKLIDGGFALPAKDVPGVETPEGKLKPADIEVRTGTEANGDKPVLPAAPDAGQVVADVPDAERLGLDEKPVVIPAIDTKQKGK